MLSLRLTVLLAARFNNLLVGYYFAPTVSNHVVVINTPSAPDLSAADSADGAGCERVPRAEDRPDP